MGLFGKKNTDEIEDVIKKGGKFRAVIFLIPLLFILMILLLSNVYTVQTGDVAIIKTFGKVTAVQGAGLQVKIPFIQTKERMTIKERGVRFGEGEDYAPLEVSTKDMQTALLDLSVSNYIDPSKVVYLYEHYTGNHLTSLVIPAIQATVQEKAGQYTIEEVVAKRQQLSNDIQEELERLFAPYGIKITRVSITDHDFSDAYSNAIEAKKVAEQEVATERQRQEKKLVEAQTAVDLAKLDIERRKLEAEANNVETASLSAQLLLKRWIDKWDGVMPKVTSDGSSIILPQELLQNPMTTEAKK